MKGHKSYSITSFAVGNVNMSIYIYIFGVLIDVKYANLFIGTTNSVHICELFSWEKVVKFRDTI